MSCQAYREELTEALLRGDVALDEAVAAHVKSCASCAEFYETQRGLVGAVETGVRMMVCDPVPASLLPSVRAKMQEVPMAGTWPRFAWAMAALAAITMSVSVSFLRRGETQRVKSAQTNRLAIPEATASVPTKLLPHREIAPAMMRKPRFLKTPARRETEPEVVVSAEEREAYNRYIRGIPVGSGNPEQTGRFLKPIEIVPQEISQLQIRNLELGSLTQEAEE